LTLKGAMVFFRRDKNHILLHLYLYLPEWFFFSSKFCIWLYCVCENGKYMILTSFISFFWFFFLFMGEPFWSCNRTGEKKNIPTCHFHNKIIYLPFSQTQYNHIQNFEEKKNHFGKYKCKRIWYLLRLKKTIAPITHVKLIYFSKFYRQYENRDIEHSEIHVWWKRMT
jgi:hypothetical protein